MTNKLDKEMMVMKLNESHRHKIRWLNIFYITSMFIISILILSVHLLIFYSFNLLTIEKEYYQSQTKELCYLSNNYRAILVTKLPNYQDLTPPALDCDSISEPFD